MKRRESLLIKMISSYVSVLFLVILIILSFGYSANAGILKEQATKNNDRELRVISDKIDSYLETLELVSAFTYERELQSLLQRVEEENSITSMRRLRSFQEFYYKRLVSLNFEGKIQDIYFIYPDGEVLHQGAGIYDETYDFTGEEWYREAVNAGGEAVIVDTHLQGYNLELPYQEEKLSYVSFAKRINEFNEISLMGVLLMDIQTKELEGMIDPLLLSDNSSVWILDGKGQAICGCGAEGTEFLLGKEKNWQGKEEGNFTLSWKQEEVLVTFRRSPKTGWYLISMNPMRSVTSDLMEVQKNLAVISGGAFLAAMLLAVWFARRIFAPIKELTRRVNQVEEGRFYIQAKVFSQDEIGFLTVSFNRMVERIRKLIEDNYLIRLRQKDAQLKALRLQINPHFLYNTLESINCIAAVNEIEEISQISKALADMFRYSIRNMKNTVTIEEELLHLENYLKIQNVRFGSRVLVEMDVEEETKTAQIIPLVLQPLVENSFRYGVEVKTVPVRIRIRIHRKGDRVYVSVWDNGSGIEQGKLEELNRKLAQEEEKESGHIGIFNVNSRLIYQYGGESGLSLWSVEGQETEVKFWIPLSKNSAPNSETQRH